MRRGVGGRGSGVSEGSGEGVREREKRFDRLGRSVLDGMDREKCECFVSSTSGIRGGAAAKLITAADSASRASPKL